MIAWRFALCVAAALPTAAQAQREFETGSLIQRPSAARVGDLTTLSPVDQGRVAMSEFARCVFLRDPTRVAAAMAAPIGTEGDGLIVRVATAECLRDGGLKFKPNVLRAVLFTEQWRRRARGGGGPKFPPVDLATAAPDNASARDHRAMLAFADCVVTRDRVAATEVLTQPTASAGQGAAYRRLQPALGPCLSEGSNVKISKPILEGALAEVMYRGVTSPSAPAEPGK